MLKIYNSLSRTEEPFVPLDPPRVRMYVCGMTVYDYPHLGNARAMIAFDVVQRWLRASGYQVTYVRNITDIDDKIIRRAAENSEPISALTERSTRCIEEDFTALGIQKPDLEPRATQHVDEMQALIRRLEERGLAYKAANGDVNFAVRKFPGYGKLSGKSLEDLRAGERVEVDATKRDPLDFVLWKRAKEGEPFWRSPWGDGRPGWHIECSAMSTKLLGAHFDIHGGGQDLQFPHHENEIAQSEGVLDRNDTQPFVKYWMHNGFVQLQDEKMSKSTGNFATIRELLKRHDPEVVRFFVVRAHYRSPLSYSDQHLEDARHALARLYTALKGAPPDAASPDWEEIHGRRFRGAMDDDFNTPEAVAVLFDLANEINRAHSMMLARQLRALGGLLGLLGRESEQFLRAEVGPGDGISDLQIAGLIAERNEARREKNFRRADEIRDELLRKGIGLEDGPQGTTWRRA
jgi:cysteinyl-tRNA synthetase